MRNTFIAIFAIAALLLFGGNIQFAKAQDSIKKTVTKKTTTIKPAAKAGYVNPYTKYHHFTSNTKAVHKPGTAAIPQADTSPASKATNVYRAAAPDSALMKDKSLNGQYRYLLTKVYHYQQPLVAALWKNFKDTLNTTRRKLTEAHAEAALQSKIISSLKADSAAKDQIALKANEISFLGLSLSKGAYNLIMWGLVVLLGATAGAVIARTGHYKHEAGYRTKLYSELEEEYKAYKTKANDKEKKLARELQTERNKVDELMGRG